MINWFNDNKRLIIRLAFLVPILSVAIISISHVVSWYDLANPISWAVYLSIAVEIAAMSAIAASSVKVKGFSVWFVFIIVTLIQFIGNIFFSYSEINVNSKEFKDWAELTLPLFDGMGFDTEDIVSQRRFLAVLEGGLLPLISLTCLHFFIKYGDLDEDTPVELEKNEEPAPTIEPEVINVPEQADPEEELLAEEPTQIEEKSVPVENIQEPKPEPAPKKEIPTNKLTSKARRRMRFS
jgi:hypothetical protein